METDNTDPMNPADPITDIARNKRICERHLANIPMDQLVEEFQLSRGRIYQILKQNGVKLERVAKYSDRDQFLGVNISEPVRLALKEEAQRRGQSVSALTSETLSEMLRECGYPVESERLQDAIIAEQ